MSILELSVSIVVAVVVLVAGGRIIIKAGFSVWWMLVPLAAVVLTAVTFDTAHAHTRAGAISYGTLVHAHRDLLIADAAVAAVMVVLLAVFAFADWPALRAPATGMAPGRPAGAAQKGRAQSSVRVVPAPGSSASVPPQASHVRALPDASAAPAGWFPSGALGSGEQSYWDGAAWTARRVWRFESWVDLPLDGTAEESVAVTH
jgi:hypothetical protein